MTEQEIKHTIILSKLDLDDISDGFNKIYIVDGEPILVKGEDE